MLKINCQTALVNKVEFDEDGAIINHDQRLAMWTNKGTQRPPFAEEPARGRSRCGTIRAPPG